MNKQGRLPFYNHFCLLMFTAMLCCFLWPADEVLAKEQAAAIDDVRVLIDISGSMKRTDPHNLRRPALRLFTSLLPKGAEAGVWTFGQWTNMLVKHGPVDNAWKNKARKAADEISSHGLRTNIEDVLRRATWDWKRPDATHRRSLILLTDGLVDVSKNAAENAASRARILNGILPRLQQANVTVHTIALSRESDSDLLEQLAAATGGWFETIDSAEGLERLFLRMFEKVSKADTLPLTDNTVTVDNSIHEATFLVFRKPGARPTTLKPPKGKKFGQKTLPAGVEWFEDERYDLITVKDPAAGEWRINADVDPDNRVMVVTDLRMVSTELPSVVAAGRPLLFTLHLEQDGKIIDRADFLQFVSATLTQQSAKGEEQQWRLRDDGKRADLKAHDGVFSTRLDESLSEGEYEFILDVDGTTFKRNSRQQVKVLGQPVKAQLEPLGQNRFALTIVPYVDLIDTETLHVAVEHVLPSGRLIKAQAKKVSAAQWYLEIDAHDHPGDHELTALVSGLDSQGESLKMQLGPIYFKAGDDAATQLIEPMRPPITETFTEKVADTPPKAHHDTEETQHHEETAPKKAKEKKTDKKTHKENQETDNIPAETSINWGIIIGLIVGLTALLSGLIFAGIKLWPKFKAWRDAKKQDKESNGKTAPAPSPLPAEEPPPAEEPAETSEEETPDLDQVIDELLDDEADETSEPDTDMDAGALDPEFDLGAETENETPELDVPEATSAEQEEENGEDLAELPADLLEPADNSDETPETNAEPTETGSEQTSDTDTVETSTATVKEAADPDEKSEGNSMADNEADSEASSNDNSNTNNDEDTNKSAQ